jgi:tripartite-type tricarboxylate transporter receptor subunit TctC
MQHSRRTVLRAAGALAATIAAPSFAQKDAAASYPSRPVKLYCPFAPAGGVDITARALAQKLSEAFGQPFIVENKVGANGTIAVNEVVKAAPDGYMLTMISSSHSVNQTLQPQHPYNLERDIVPITQATRQPYTLVVNPSVPAKTIGELIALAKQQPGSLSYGSSGIGGLSHLSGALLSSLAKINILHVPYKGGAPAMADVVSGQINMLFSTILQSHAFIQSGKLRPLAVTTAARAGALPDTPTMQEAGVKGYEIAGWYGVVGPKGLPQGIVEKLNGELVRILQLKETKERLAADGSEAVGSTPQQFAAHISSEVARWRALINEMGIKA